jgi:hypothetical protein
MIPIKRSPIRRPTPQSSAAGASCMVKTAHLDDVCGAASSNQRINCVGGAHLVSRALFFLRGACALSFLGRTYLQTRTHRGIASVHPARPTAFRQDCGVAGRLRGQVHAAMTTSGMASAIHDRPHQMLL